MLNAKLIIISAILFAILIRGGLTVAANVEITPYIGLKESYTDNAIQQSSGGQDEFVTQVIPGFNLQSAGGRAILDIGYELQYIRYTKSERDNSAVNHKINANTSINLIRNEFILDAGVNRSQENIVDNTRLPNAEIFNVADPTDVTRTTVNPKYQKRFGASGRLLLSYANTHTRYSGEQVNQSNFNTQTYRAKLSDKAGGGNIKWELGYSKLDNSSDPDAIGQEKKYLTLNFRVGRRVAFFYQAGEEEEFFWLTGFKWVPNKRNALSAGYGERFFGDTKTFSFTHQNKKTGFEITYTEEVVDQSIVVLQLDIPLEDDGTRQRDDGEFKRIFTPAIITGVFVQKQLKSAFSLTGRKLRLRIGLLNEERISEREPLQETEKTRGGFVEVGWRIAKNLSLVLESNAQETFFANNVREDKYVNNTLSLKQGLGEKVALSYELRRTELDSNEADVGYTENAISVALKMEF